MVVSMLVGAALGTLSVLLTFLVLACALTGLGLVLRRWFGLRRAEVDDVFLAFWMGFGLVLVFLIAWNFVFAIGPTALALVLGAGIVGLAVERRTLAGAFEHARLPRWTWLAVAGFGLWISNLATGRMLLWDTGLYHMQVVKWATTYPAVPGVANVFGPLGFNNASLLYTASLDVGPWKDRAWHVSNGLFVWALGAQVIASAARLLRGDGTRAAIDACALIVMTAVVSTALADKVSSFSTQLPMSMLVLAVVLRGYATAVDASRTDRERVHDCFCMATLAAVATAVKASAAVFAAVVLVVCCVGIWKRSGARDGSRWRSLAVTLAAVGCIGILWAARGVVLSGYPLFPTPALGFPVEWRVPEEHARAEFEFVVHSSLATTRATDFVAGRTEGVQAWFSHWIESVMLEPFAVLVPSALTILACVALLAARRRGTRASRTDVRRGWGMLAPIGAAIAAWFAVAPMPDYGEPYFWGLAAIVGAQVFRRVSPSATATRRLVVVGCVVGLTPCVVYPFVGSARVMPSDGALVRFAKTNVTLPDPGHWFEVTNRHVQLRTYTTQSGLVVNVPCGEYGRSWDAPVPCTPNPAPNLRLRVPDRIDRGFVVDGAWQMLDWPEPWRPELLPAIREGWRKRGVDAAAE